MVVGRAGKPLSARMSAMAASAMAALTQMSSCGTGLSRNSEVAAPSPNEAIFPVKDIVVCARIAMRLDVEDVGILWGVLDLLSTR